MNHYGRGASKATSTTLCQKCLKRGHYSYECKAAAQERPYASRPSRTQQLRNPKLAPSLTNVALEDPLPKEVITDQHLNKIVKERSRKPSLHQMDNPQLSRKRSRDLSPSESSTSSVSTISTAASRSPSISQTSSSPTRHGARDKRRRGASAASSTDDRHARSNARAVTEVERNIRPRRNSTSPAERGRRRSRSVSSDRRQRKLSPARNSQINDRVANLEKDLPGDNTDFAGQSRGQYSSDHGVGRSHRADDSILGNRIHSRQRSLSPYSKRLALNQDNR